MSGRVLAGLVLLAAVGAAVSEEEKAGKQVAKKLEGKGSPGYLLYLPKGYDKGGKKSWPVLLFLHGSGERGTDLEKVKKHGPPKLVAAGKDLPFIVVSPQASPEAKRGWDPATLHALLDEVEKTYRVDPDRIYVTGLSMGGRGTWDLAASRPERFAAIVPICGGGRPADAEKIKGLPTRIFQGAKDPAVRLETAERMLKALKDAGAKDVELKVYPDLAHDCWTVTYNDAKLYEWLLKQKRAEGKKGG
jgi:predicted peptidase